VEFHAGLTGGNVDRPSVMHFSLDATGLSVAEARGRND
jgi:hypothetical protein